MTREPEDWAPEVLELVHQPWSIELKAYPDGGHFARVVELPGCMTEADTAAEALDALEEARALWIEAALAEGKKVPVPLASTEYSGKIFVRTSPDLHRAVAEAAARQGVSMSQWASEVLARAAARGEASASVVRAIDDRLQALLDAHGMIAGALGATTDALLEQARSPSDDEVPEDPQAEQAG